MLAITSTSTMTGGEFVVDVDVTDGVYTDTDQFTVTVESATPQELALAIPNRALTLNSAATLDLWTYTTYSGDQADLLYTATTPASPLFTATLTGTHYLNIASTSPISGGEFVVDVSVGDGLSTTTAAFTVSVTTAPTLSLWIPDGIGVPVPTGNGRTLDLWEFTTYHLSDKSGLIYTATRSSGTRFDFAIVNSHYLSITSETDFAGYPTSAEIEVSDGTLYDMIEVEFVSDDYPVLSFYGEYYDVAPNPFYAPAGTISYLTFNDEYRSPQPLYRFVRATGGDAVYYTLGEGIPEALGARVITDTRYCLYAWCYFLTFEPAMGLSGNYQVPVIAWTAGGLSDTDVLNVGILQRIYLPMTIVGYPPVATMKPVDNPDGDGDYFVEWTVRGGGHTGYELQRDTDPNFSNPTSIQRSSYESSYRAETLTPGVYYWRIRPYNSTQNFAWSNVAAVNVGNFAYLYVEPLCAFGLRVELFGPANYSVEYTDEWCNDEVYWRSVPAGTYTTRLTWLGGSIVENVPGTYLGDGGEYIIRADEWPNSAWKPY